MSRKCPSKWIDSIKVWEVYDIFRRREGFEIKDVTDHTLASS
jgi:hypothetical protein